MLTECQNRVNLIVHSAGILDSYGATSYEQFIVDLEIISMIEAFLYDIKDDPEDFSDRLNATYLLEFSKNSFAHWHYNCFRK